MTRILITGSRNWSDRMVVYRALNRYIAEHCQMGYDYQGEPVDYDKSDVTIVHGACPTGADVIADDWAIANGLDPERHPADWDRYGKAAGPIRNQEMVDLGADVCLAFPHKDSRGTKHCMEAARKAGIPTLVYYEGEPA